MSDSNSATPSLPEILEKALTEGEVILEFSSPEAAMKFRMRLYVVRRTERKRNLKSFGTEYSAWDQLSITIQDSSLRISSSIDGLISIS